MNGFARRYASKALAPCDGLAARSDHTRGSIDSRARPCRSRKGHTIPFGNADRRIGPSLPGLPRVPSAGSAQNACKLLAEQGRRDRAGGIGPAGSGRRDRAGGIGRRGSVGGDRSEGIGRRGSVGGDRSEGIGRRESVGGDRSEGIGTKKKAYWLAFLAVWNGLGSIEKGEGMDSFERSLDDPRPFWEHPRNDNAMLVAWR